MPERHPRGLLDTSVVIELGRHEESDLPYELAVSTVTMTELAVGLRATADPQRRADLMLRLQTAEATFEQIPFDARAVRAYGRVHAAEVAAGRRPHGRRVLDLLVAATALANTLPLYTRNRDDFAALGDLLRVVAVSPAQVPAGPRIGEANRW